MTQWNFCPSCGSELAGERPAYCATCGLRLESQRPGTDATLRSATTAPTSTGSNLLHPQSLSHQAPIDVRRACKDFNKNHKCSTIKLRKLKMTACLHFGEFAAQCLGSFGSPSLLDAYVALEVPAPSKESMRVLDLLSQAGLDDGWLPIITMAMDLHKGSEITLSIVGGLYERVEQRIYASPPSTSLEALQLAFLVEGTVALEYWRINKFNSFNYPAQWNVEKWWPRYLARIDPLLAPEDLSRLSSVAGGCTETEALSSVTPPGRLIELFSLDSTTVSANPNLPSDFIRREMASWPELAFHPNADPEQAWNVVRRFLETDWYPLVEVTREYDYMRDSNWFQLSGFAVDSPQALALFDRMAKWCDDNIEDDDEREEVKDSLGLP